MHDVSTAVLLSLATEVRERDMEIAVSRGEVTIKRRWFERVDTGGEFEKQVVFRGSRAQAFEVLCRLVNHG